jgi:hypothetical protein
MERWLALENDRSGRRKGIELVVFKLEGCVRKHGATLSTGSCSLQTPAGKLASKKSDFQSTHLRRKLSRLALQLLELVNSMHLLSEPQLSPDKMAHSPDEAFRQQSLNEPLFSVLSGLRSRSSSSSRPLAKIASSEERILGICTAVVSTSPPPLPSFPSRPLGAESTKCRAPGSAPSRA